MTNKNEQMWGLPLICHFCGKKIVKYGRESESLCIHSLDGDHDNWDPSNKVPAHKGCHGKYHKEGTHQLEETKQKLSKSQIRAHIQRGKTTQQKPLIKSGGSRVIVIPDFWLQSLKRVHGTLPTEMDLELNDETITIHPVYDDGTEAKIDEIKANGGNI